MIGAKTENQHQKIGIFTLLEITRVQKKKFTTLLVITRVTSNFSLPYPTLLGFEKSPTRHSLIMTKMKHQGSVIQVKPGSMGIWHTPGKPSLE